MVPDKIKREPKILWFLQVSYVAVILLSDWFAIRFIEIGTVDTNAGIIIFPLTFIISDLITEVYGYKYARLAIWSGFLFNFIFILYGQAIIHFPSPNYAIVDNNRFDQLIRFNDRIIISSMLAYLFSEPLNSYILAKMKIAMNGRLVYLRFILSTTVASFFDSFIFGTLAFYGVMPNNDLIKFNITIWLIKVTIEIVGLPLSLFIVQKLKDYEGVDMYDIDTKFSIFNFDASYQPINNKYSSKSE